MRTKIALVVAVGFTLILVSSGGTLKYLRDADRRVAAVEDRLAALGDRRAYPVLIRDVEAGELLRGDDFRRIELPVSYVPEGILQELPATGGAGPAGYRSLSDLKAGRLLFPADLGLDDGGETLVTLDASGFLISPANLADLRPVLAPGVRLDLFWQHDIGGGARETRLVARGARVLGLPQLEPGRAHSTLPDGARIETKVTAIPMAQPAVAPAAKVEPVNGSILIEAPTPVLAKLLQVRGQGVLFAALSGGLRVASDGTFVVGNRDLLNLPLVTREGQAAAPSPLQAVLPGNGEAQSCPLAIVRSAARQIIQVPCE